MVEKTKLHRTVSIWAILGCFSLFFSGCIPIPFLFVDTSSQSSSPFSQQEQNSQPEDSSLPSESSAPEANKPVGFGEYTLPCGMELQYFSSVHNDVTGRWRRSVTSSTLAPADYAVEYYNTMFVSDDEIHGIWNSTLNTTTKISVSGNLLFADTHEYVDGEEHDANILFSGLLLDSKIIDKETGEPLGESGAEPESSDTPTQENSAPESSSESSAQTATGSVIPFPQENESSSALVSQTEPLPPKHVDSPSSPEESISSSDVGNNGTIQSGRSNSSLGNGTWGEDSTTNEITGELTRTAYWTNGGKSYHFSESCPSLSRSKNINTGTLQDALNAGKKGPCNNCANGS